MAAITTVNGAGGTVMAAGGLSGSPAFFSGCFLPRPLRWSLLRELRAARAAGPLLCELDRLGTGRILTAMEMGGLR
jgi:hypothetical protein